MKTTIFSIILAAALFCLPSYAQLKVYQNGNVSVKSTDSTSTVGLSVGSSTYPSAYSVYLYSLIVDGNEVDTKRMIISK